MSNLLSIQDLKVSYGMIQALRGISLEVQDGSIVAILGANGGGKTTLLKTISGLIEPQSGAILFQGESIIGLSADKIATRGLLQSPEGRQIFQDISVEENLLVGGFALKALSGQSRKERSLSQLQKVYQYFPILRDRKDQVAKTLSGGEQQMLAIGRALMGAPKLLILDEPSLGLAPLIIRDIFRIIKELQADGVTVLLVEQNALQTLKIADYAYVLELGTILMQGPASTLLQTPDLVEAYLGKASHK